MKLLTKITLFITLSKLAIVILFVSLLPLLVERISSGYTNYYLREQQKKVMEVIGSNGIEYYLQGEPNYGSYTMLKEEYISLEPSTDPRLRDTIETAQRVVESDTLNYRILTHVFYYGDKRYIVEIAKKTEVVDQYSRPLQRIALYLLISLILVTLLIDLVVTRVLLRPLGQIIRSKLVDRKFPFNEPIEPIKTSTYDFNYLDRSLIDLMNRIREDFEKEREFTSNASHELMTPIGILQHKMENLMMEGNLEEDAQQKLIGMMKTLNRLKKIVHSLLLISRIENAQYGRKDTVGFRTLVDDLMEELGHRMEEKELTFTNNLRHSVRLTDVNQELLFQLFYNLVNNAIKYNRPNGAIELSDALTSEGDYIVHIADTGVGIDPADIPVIFDRFKKLGKGSGEGFGLGLSIVKTIASYHSLKLKASSEAGIGTIISVEFPAGMVRPY